LGFGVPIERWLRGGLKEWAESLLSERALLDDGFMNSKAIRKCWDSHIFDGKNKQNSLWTVLMLQAWLAEQHHG
jgi:asparagine synthase (glutamine-hydrolysing)